MARDVIGKLGPGMLCLADRQFFSYDLWKQAQATGADLLWRVKGNLRLELLERFCDGSYLSVIYPSEKDRRHNKGGLYVRVIEYKLDGVRRRESLPADNDYTGSRGCSGQ